LEYDTHSHVVPHPGPLATILNQPGNFVHWSIFYVSVANLVVIAAGRPVAWMRVVVGLQQRELGGAQARRIVLHVDVLAVDACHQLGGRNIRDLPQGRNHRAGAEPQERAHPPKRLVTC